jgi:hypothetical protein
MTTLWTIPVATVAERTAPISRRLYRELATSPLPRDARPSRARHERLPASLRVSGASSPRK